MQPQRRLEELPYQLERAEEFEKLRNCLGDLKLLVQLYPSGKFDLTRYWRSVEKNSKHDAVTTYTDALKESNNFPTDVIRADVYYKVASFLEDSAKFDGSLRVFKEALVHYTNAAQNLAVAKTTYAIARIHSTLGNYDEAEKAMRETLVVYARELGEESVDASHVLNRLGALYLDTNRLSEAEAAFKKALAIRQAKLGASHSRVGQTLKRTRLIIDWRRRLCANLCLRHAHSIRTHGALR